MRIWLRTAHLSGYPDRVGPRRSRWQDGGRAWARLNSWFLVFRDPGNYPAPNGQDAATALADVALTRHLLDELELHLVRTARKDSVPWSEIATQLGVSRQTVWEKWRDLDEEVSRNDP